MDPDTKEMLKMLVRVKLILLFIVLMKFSIRISNCQVQFWEVEKVDKSKSPHFYSQV